MKRSRLNRKTPLKARTSLSRRGILNRQSERTRAASKPRKPLVSRPKPVTPEERRARKLVRARSGDVCEGCRQAEAKEWAHRVTRSVGPWCPANGLHLCNDLTARPGKRGCHEWSHGKDRPEAEALGWILRTHHDYLITPVWLPSHGLVLLGTDGSITPAEKEAA